MDYTALLQTIFSATFTFTLGGVVAWVSKVTKDTRNENTAIRDGVRALLYDRIVQGYLHFHDDLGYMPLQAKESMQDIYNNYRKLDGNGLGEQMYSRMKNLPTERNPKLGGTE